MFRSPLKFHQKLGRDKIRVIFVRYSFTCFSLFLMSSSSSLCLLF